MVPILKNSFAKMCNVIDKGDTCIWNKCTDWMNWEANKKPSELNLEEWCLQKRCFQEAWQRKKYYEKFFNENLSHEFSNIVNDMKTKIDSMLMTRKKKNHIILPSFFKLLNTLNERKRSCKST